MKRQNYLKNHQSAFSIGAPLLTLIFAGALLSFSTFYEPSWSYDWTGIRPEIKDSVQLIEQYNRITSGVVGISARTPKQFHTRRWLTRNADLKELQQLCNYPNYTIRAIAYEALILKEKGSSFELLKNVFQDTTTFIHYQAGCIGEMKLLGEYLMEDVLSLSDLSPPPSPLWLEKLGLSDNEIAVLKVLYREQKAKKWDYLNSYGWRK